MSRLMPALAVALTILTSAGARADKTFEKEVALPREGGVVKLNAKLGDVVIQQVAVRNAPNKDDFAKAKKNPRESCRPKFQVRMSNPGKQKVKLKVEVKLVHPDGRRLLACDTKESFDPGVKDFDSNLCWLQGMEVADWPNARLHVSVTLKE